MGLKAAKAIITRYPEYGKAPPEYLAGLAKLLATYEGDVLAEMTDLRSGISARHKFLPTPADFVEFADQIFARRASMRDLRNGRVPEPIGRGGKPRPFPRLFDAFQQEPALLVRTFDTLSEASKALARHGTEAARDVLRAGRSIR